MFKKRKVTPSTQDDAAPILRPKRPGARGWRGRGNGESAYVQAPAEWRATTMQVCGLYPFAMGGASPMVGVPLGRHLFSQGTVCGDPISWFQRAKLISNPSVFVLGLPGLGKSSILRRMATGLSGYGVIPLVLGDLKPDYVEMVRALGGQVITLGRDRGALNVLDPGGAIEAAARLRANGFEKEARTVLADANARRLNMVIALISILRNDVLAERERTVLDRALKYLDKHFDGVPVISDLLEVVRQAPNELREVALDRGDIKRYQAITEHLEASLVSLANGSLGDVFSRQTTVPMERDRPVVYDLSEIDELDEDLRAAALLACWSNGFGTVEIASLLADAGLEPRRHYFVIMDELWQALVVRGMVNRINALTRLNRAKGTGIAMCTHTMADLNAIPDESDRMKARGFVERAGMVICGGLPESEMNFLQGAMSLTKKERDLLTSWQDPAEWDPALGREAEPPGLGKFLIKVGGKAGIPIRVQLTEIERPVNDTDTLWHEQSRIGDRADTTKNSRIAEEV